MAKFILNKFTLIFFSLLFFLLSCGDRKTRYVLPEETFQQLLIEMHLADGISYARNIANFSRADSVNYTRAIYDKFNVTAAQFDSTVAYYSNHPSEYEEIYNVVLDSLRAMEARLEQVMRLEKEQMENDPNLWYQRNEYIMPENGAREEIFFSIPIQKTGLYSISVDATIYEDDQSKDPGLEVFFWKQTPDQGQDTLNFKRLDYDKTGQTAKYHTTLSLKDASYSHLRGKLAAHKPKDGEWEKHMEIKNIEIKHTPLLKESQERKTFRVR